MRLLVVSDTHGRIEKAEEIIVKQGPFDLVIHLGDYYNDAQHLEIRTGVEVIAVKGNMDGSYSGDDYRILPTEFGDILLVHGHMEKVKYGLTNLMYRAEELGCKAAFFGHTHTPIFEELSGLYLLNPGSLTLPRLSAQGSYAVVEVTKGRLDASILYLKSC